MFRCMRLIAKTKVWGLALVLGGAAAAGVAGTVAAATSKDEDAIKARVAAFVGLFNDHDAKSMSAFWIPDGSLVNPAGLAGKGPAEIEKVILSDLATVLRETKMTMQVVGYRPIGKDAAWVEVDQAVSGIKGAEGKPMPTVTFHVPLLMVKRGQVWMIAEARPYAYLAPPTQ